MSDYQPQAGLTTHGGLSGAGKTHLITEEIFSFVRHGFCAITIDRMNEVDHVPDDMVPFTAAASTVDELIKYGLGSSILYGVVKPSMANVEDETDRACQWAMADPILRGVAIPEGHRAIPKNGQMVMTHVASIITEWRHHNVALWIDTQRFAKLNTDVVELSKTVRLFAMSGRLDLASCIDLGGRELAEAVKICADYLDRGERGWHVNLGFRRSPPFQIVAPDGRRFIYPHKASAKPAPSMKAIEDDRSTGKAIDIDEGGQDLGDKSEDDHRMDQG